MIDRLRTIPLICLTLLLTVSVPLFAASGAAAAQPVPLAAPQLLQPGNKALAKGTSFTQSWMAVEGAAHYEYESYLDAARTKLRAKQKVSGTSKTVARVPDGTFWWRVRAVAQTGSAGVWSATRQVTVDGTPPTIRPLQTIGEAPVQGTVRFVFESVDKHPYRITSGVFSEVPSGGLPIHNPDPDDESVVQAVAADVRTTVTLNINTLSMPNGRQTIIINAEDRAGNVYEQRFYFNVANPLPADPAAPPAGSADSQPPAPKITQSVHASNTTGDGRQPVPGGPDQMGPGRGAASEITKTETGRVLGLSTSPEAGADNQAEQKTTPKDSPAAGMYWIAGVALAAMGAAGGARFLRKRSAA